MSAATQEMYKAAADVLNKRLAQRDGLFGISREMVDAALAAAPASAELQPVAWTWADTRNGQGYDTTFSEYEPTPAPWVHDPVPLYAFPPDLTAEIARLREALEWYGEQARLARLVHSEGDKGRHALAGDGGTRAREALASRRVA